MGGVPHWSRGEHEGEGVAEQIVFTAPIIPHPSFTTLGGEGGGKRIVNEGVKLSLKEREWEEEEVVLFLSFFSHHLTVVLVNCERNWSFPR